MTWLLFYSNNRSRSLLPSLSLGVDMNIECYPAHGDEHGGGEVDGEDVGAQHAGQHDLHPVDAVVLCNNRTVCSSFFAIARKINTY